MAAVGVWIASAVRARGRLRREVERLPVVHRRGRLTVAASDVAATPFSLVSGRRAWIVVPTDLIACPKRLGLAVAHEAAHVRRRDVAWDIAVEAAGAAFAWNPAVHWWRRLHGELQEAACDASVLARYAGSAEAYAEMLVWVPGQSMAPRFVPAGPWVSARGRFTGG